VSCHRNGPCAARRSAPGIDNFHCVARPHWQMVSDGRWAIDHGPMFRWSRPGGLLTARASAQIIASWPCAIGWIPADFLEQAASRPGPLISSLAKSLKSASLRSRRGPCRLLSTRRACAVCQAKSLNEALSWLTDRDECAARCCARRPLIVSEMPRPACAITANGGLS